MSFLSCEALHWRRASGNVPRLDTMPPMNDLEPRLRSPLLSPRFSRIAGCAAIILVVHALRSVSFFERTFNPEGGAAWQWDFDSYYYGLKVHQAGANPYDPAELARLAGHTVFPFAYPPHTLAFFSLFDRGDAAASKTLYLEVKLVTVAALMALWTLGFIPKGVRGWFLAFAAVGIDVAVARDVTAGNVSAFEQIAVWSGILALVRGVPGVFCLLVLLAAQFKLQPLVLLGLLWFRPVRRRWLWLGLTLVAQALIYTGLYLHDPQLTTEYFRSSTTIAAGESGLGNPSALKLWTELLMMVLSPYDVFDGINRRYAAMAVYPLTALLMCWVTFRSLPKDRTDRRWVYVGMLTFAVTAPRMASYSWGMVLVPVFELLRRLLKPTSERNLRGAGNAPGSGNATGERNAMGAGSAMGAARASLPVVLLAALFLAMPLRETAWIYRSYLLTFMLWAATIFSYDGNASTTGEGTANGEETHIRGSPQKA